ncbi:hypothetical protein ACJZ2D_009737 [Fusarium nematophilum]
MPVDEEHRIRHKKCDEAKPACYPCTSTGRRCDFLDQANRHFTPDSGGSVVSLQPVSHQSVLAAGLLTGVPAHPSPAEHLRDLGHLEVLLFDYFRFTCAQEFSLYFESPWENFVLRATYLEPWGFHAALAISALSRTHYAPEQVMWLPGTVIDSLLEFATLQYSQAIRSLNQRLDATAESAELAALASVLFINIEFLGQALSRPSSSPTLVYTHLRGGLAVLESLGRGSARGLSQNAQYLEQALLGVRHQLQHFNAYSQEGEKISSLGQRQAHETAHL